MPIVVATPLPVGTGLDLCAIWFNAASDLADVMSFSYAGDTVGLGATTQAEVRQLATRRRIVRSSTTTYEAVGLTLLKCTAMQRQWLRDHIGQLLCVRDHVGTKVYGVYTEAPFEVSTFPRDDTFYTEVKLTLEQVDHSEAE